MIPQETVNRILDTAQIVDVVGDFVTLKKRGANHIACCPFHNEKTPSFSVSASKGIYKCFGCGKSGTAVGFVMEHENMTYVEALKYLAKKYHIEVVKMNLLISRIDQYAFENRHGSAYRNSFKGNIDAFCEFRLAADNFHLNSFDAKNTIYKK